MNYFFSPFLNCFNFTGKSSLKEFWFFYLINFFISILLILTKKFHAIQDIDVYYRYIYVFPLISLGVRRLRDAGFNVWLFLVPFVNLILAGFPSVEKTTN
jgi:uncharacterized membrane protein YhaH (DUF805 family)